MDLGDGTYIITTVTYDGLGRSQDRVVFYNNPACTTRTGLVKTDPNTLYTVGKNPTKIGGMDAFDINYTITSWKLTQNGTLIKSGGPVPTQFDIIAVKDNKLYTSGLNRAFKGPITNPAQRPNTLDMQNYFLRQ